MKLKTYIKMLQAIEQEHGGDLEVWYGADDEGNSFQPVSYEPSVGSFDDFYEKDVVCVN